MDVTIKNRRIALSKDSPRRDDGDKFAATIAVRRHTQRPPSVFGVNTIGQIDADNGGVFGTAKQAPGTTFQATLIRIIDR